MKNLNSILSTSIVLCASLVLFSCKKQISETISNQSGANLQTANVDECKPAILGVYSVYPSNPSSGEWITLAQKWYADGKVKYLKAKHGSYSGTVLDPMLELMFDLGWGEVTYHGNQVFLTDVEKNRLLMRVTLDNQGRPVASYYYNAPAADIYMNDTTYYYYNGDRLDYMISLYKTLPYGTTPFVGWRKYLFSYDSWGNLVKAEFPGSSRLNLQYDYNKPVNCIMNNFHVTSSLKLLEYLKLIELPMHYAVTRTNFETSSAYGFFSEVYYAQYKDYVIKDGMVQSYVFDDPYRVVTFYNGWDCDAPASMSAPNSPGNGVANLKQFQELYPNQR